MSFVATRFPLPSVTSSGGAVVPFSFAPGRCAVDFKRGLKARSSSIRPAVRRTRLSVVVPPNRSLGEIAGFWDSLVKGVTGAVKGFAAGGPAGAIAGGAGGAIDGSTGKGKGAVQQAPQQQLGPLASVSTGTIVGVGLGFSALILVLASMGRR